MVDITNQNVSRIIGVSWRIIDTSDTPVSSRRIIPPSIGDDTSDTGETGDTGETRCWHCWTTVPGHVRHFCSGMLR